VPSRQTARATAAASVNSVVVHPSCEAGGTGEVAAASPTQIADSDTSMIDCEMSQSFSPKLPHEEKREEKRNLGDPAGPSQPSALPRTLSRARKMTVPTVIAGQVKHIRTNVEQT